MKQGDDVLPSDATPTQRSIKRAADLRGWRDPAQSTGDLSTCPINDASISLSRALTTTMDNKQPI